MTRFLPVCLGLLLFWLFGLQATAASVAGQPDP